LAKWLRTNELVGRSTGKGEEVSEVSEPVITELKKKKVCDALDPVSQWEYWGRQQYLSKS